MITITYKKYIKLVSLIKIVSQETISIKNLHMNYYTKALYFSIYEQSALIRFILGVKNHPYAYHYSL